MPGEKKKTALILLAAGRSSRMNGTPKQSLRIGGKSLLRRATETALEANFDLVKVVLGAYADCLRKEIEDLPVGIAINENWAVGISSSIKTGLAALEDEVLDAVIIMLCDQPLITAKILRSLCDVFAETGKPIAACRYEKALGVPALFAREFFADLINLRGDEGAKKLIEKHLDETAFINVSGAAFDVDTSEDFEKIKGLHFSD